MVRFVTPGSNTPMSMSFYSALVVLAESLVDSKASLAKMARPLVHSVLRSKERTPEREEELREAIAVLPSTYWNMGYDEYGTMMLESGRTVDESFADLALSLLCAMQVPSKFSLDFSHPCPLIALS